MAKKKKLAPAEELAELVRTVESDFDRWAFIFAKGANDPGWCDGVNINLKRNHIIYGKRKIDELCREHGLPVPEIVQRETPEEMPNEFMARPETILAQGKDFLRALYDSAEWQKLRETLPLLTSDGKEILYYITRYVDSVELYMQSAIPRDLPLLRARTSSDWILQSITQRLAALQPEHFRKNHDEQLILFGFGEEQSYA